MATWNVDRKKGGTYEFEIDAQGNYQLKKSGFGDVKSLNLPELKAEAAKTTTAATTTQDVKKVSDQTQKAFGDVQPFYYDKKGGEGNQYTSEYQMKKEGDLATDQAMTKGDNFAQARQAMTSDAAYSGVTPSSRQPGLEVANKGITKQDTTPGWAKEADTGRYSTKKADDTTQSAFSVGRANYDLDKNQQTKTAFEGDRQWGPKPSKGMPTTRVPDRISSPLRPSVEKPTLTQTALKQVNTASNVLAKAVGFVMSPVSSAIGMVAGALQETPTNKHDISYFNVDENGRIAGNASTDLFAGMNRVSSGGNLSQAGASRIGKRNSAKTQANLSKLSPERKAAFNAKTKEMERQLDDYNRSKNDSNIDHAKSKGVNISQLNPHEMKNVAETGNAGGDGCFLKGTQVTMADKSTKAIEKVDLGDEVAVGGKVFAVGKFLNTELYDYKGIKVSGSHMVNEDGTWIRVRDTKHGKSLGDDLNTVYVFGSENRRILINDILFTDYFEVSEQDKLVDNSEDFFNNWKDYGNNVDVDNVATLNMTYEI